MKKYRKKPVVIEAVVWDGKIKAKHPITKWIKESGGQYSWSPEPQKLRIHTYSGLVVVHEGDYIIKGVEGEFYPCSPSIFDSTYEEVT